MGTGKHVVDLEAELVHETEKARLFNFDEDKDNVWIPKSQHEWDPEESVVTMWESVALDKGLI